MSLNTNIDLENNTIQFDIVKILENKKLSLLNRDEIQLQELQLSYTFALQLLQTEYEMFYAIIPFSLITQEMIDQLKTLYYSLLIKLPYDLVSKIIQDYLISLLPELTATIIKNTNNYTPERIIHMKPHYILDNNIIDINIDSYLNTEYLKTYIKKQINDGYFLIGSRDHFAYDKIISIMDKSDTDYIKSYLKLEEDERNTIEWRYFSSYID